MFCTVPVVRSGAWQVPGAPGAALPVRGRGLAIPVTAMGCGKAPRQVEHAASSAGMVRIPPPSPTFCIRSMGRHDLPSGFTDEQLRAFMKAILADVHAVERMLDEDRFETGIRRIGAEQEMFLLDKIGRAWCGADAMIKNPRITNYIVPTALDAPPFETALVEAPFEFGPGGGAKGIGELPMDGGAAAIAAAVEHATGIAVHHLPLTPERLYAASLGRPLGQRQPSRGEPAAC